MPYYRTRFYIVASAQERVCGPELISQSDEPLSFARRHGFGSKDLLGRSVIEVDVLNHDEARVTSRKPVVVFLQGGDAPYHTQEEIEMRVIAPGHPLTLTRTSLYLHGRERERLTWSKDPGLDDWD
jgi:hypothetical protein